MAATLPWELARAGIEGSRVYEVAKSEDTKALNAYVAGFGDTKRIVLWDTTIAKMDEQELLFVMGHEMGHYVLGHLWKGIAFFALLILLTLYAIHRTAGWLLAKYHQRLIYLLRICNAKIFRKRQIPFQIRTSFSFIAPCTDFFHFTKTDKAHRTMYMLVIDWIFSF